MQLVLYTATGSRGLMIEWLLEEIGAPFERVWLDLAAGEHKREAYLAVHPLGAVPALEVDGTPMIESLAMSLFLADAFPEAAMAPALTSEARIPYLQWMVYATATIEPALSGAFIRALGLADAERTEVARPDEREKMSRVLTPLERGFRRGHVLEHGFSAADVLVGVELYWASQVGLLRECPHAQRYLQGVMVRPAFQKCRSREADVRG